jgi:hypothetical protein
LTPKPVCQRGRDLCRDGGLVSSRRPKKCRQRPDDIAGICLAEAIPMRLLKHPLALLPLTLLLAGGAAGLVACSSDDSNPPITHPGDAGPDGHTPERDAGPDSNPGDAAPDHSTNDAETDAESDAGDGGQQADCGALVILPPLITVENAAGGSITCDAKFAELTADGGVAPDNLGAASCNTAQPPSDCPPYDGGTSECTYVLLSMANPTPVSVQVTQSGFAPGKADGVHSGAGGCGNKPPSDVVVKLTATDGGTDAGGDAH